MGHVVCPRIFARELGADIGEHATAEVGAEAIDAEENEGECPQPV